MNSPLSNIFAPRFSSILLGAALLSGVSTAQAQAEGAASTAAAAPKAEAKAEAKPAEEAKGDEAKPKASGDEAAAAEKTAGDEVSDEDREKARVAFEAGLAALKDDKASEALAKFKEAHAVIPSPHAEYYIAVATDKADAEDSDPAALVAAYEAFLSNPGSAHAGADKVAEAKSRRDELKKGLPAEYSFVTDPEGATVTVDGEAKEGVTPLSIALAPGAHKLEFNLEGYDTFPLELEAAGGDKVEQQVALVETPPPVVAAPVVAAEPEPKKNRKVPAIVTLSLGGAGLISGTVFGIMALNSKSKFKDDPTTDNADAAERNALIADMSFGIALTLGVTGIVLLTAANEDEAEEAAERAKRRQVAKNRLVVAPYASPRGAGAAARLTF